MSMACPDCDKVFRGRRCSCGYEHKGKFPTWHASPDGIIEREKADALHLAESKKWLLDRGITRPGMTTMERMKELAKYRKQIAREPAEPGVKWAQDLIRRAEDEPLPPMAIEMASEALKRAGLSYDDGENYEIVSGLQVLQIVDETGIITVPTSENYREG